MLQLLLVYNLNHSSVVAANKSYKRHSKRRITKSATATALQKTSERKRRSKRWSATPIAQNPLQLQLQLYKKRWSTNAKSKCSSTINIDNNNRKRPISTRIACAMPAEVSAILNSRRPQASSSSKIEGANHTHSASRCNTKRESLA